MAIFKSTSHLILTNKRPVVSLNDTIFIGGLNDMGQSLGSPIGAFLLDRFSVRTVIIIGTTLALLGAILSSFTTNYIVFDILYGLVFGLGIGIAYLPPLI